MKRTLALICVIVAGQSSFGLGDAVLVPMPRTCAFSPGRYDLPSGTLVPSLVSFSEDAAIRHEGYRISITTNGIAVVSSDAAGAFYALKTLEQLGDPENGKLVFPLAEIEDWPSYRYRGMHFDDCRHFFGKIHDSIRRDHVKRSSLHLADDRTAVHRTHCRDTADEP